MSVRARGPRSTSTGRGAGPGTPGRRDKGLPRFPAWVVPAAMLAVLGLATLAIGSLNDYARRSGDVQVRLAYLGEEAGEQVVLAHNVLSKRRIGSEAIEEATRRSLTSNTSPSIA